MSSPFPMEGILDTIYNYPKPYALNPKPYASMPKDYITFQVFVTSQSPSKCGPRMSFDTVYSGRNGRSHCSGENLRGFRVSRFYSGVALALPKPFNPKPCLEATPSIPGALPKNVWRTLQNPCATPEQIPD